MSILAGPFSMLLAALLLSGADKVVRPVGAARALVTAGFVPGSSPRRRHRRSLMLARTLGAVELVIAMAAAYAILVLGSTDVAALTAVFLVAALYAGFALFLKRIEGISPGGSCGCFGGSVSGPLHVVANLGAAGLAIGMGLSMVLLPSEQPLRHLLADAGIAIPLVSSAVVGGWLLLVTPSLVTELRQAQSGASRSVPTFAISKRIRQ